MPLTETNGYLTERDGKCRVREFGISEHAALSDQAHTVCFSGHRPNKLPGKGNDDALSLALRNAVEAEIKGGKRIFINGGMAGFDVLAGETVITLRQKYPEIICVTAAPFRKGYFNNKNWTSEWKARALTLYKASDIAFTLAENYHPGIYYERDDYMVEHSCGIICYYIGEITGREGKTSKGGGTEYTVNRAHDLGLSLVNLASQLSGANNIKP